MSSCLTAKQGLGITLGPVAMIRELLELGRLVIALDIVGASACYYTLNCADGWQQQPRILAFRDWLNHELGVFSKLDSVQTIKLAGATA